MWLCGYISMSARLHVCECAFVSVTVSVCVWKYVSECEFGVCKYGNVRMCEYVCTCKGESVSVCLWVETCVCKYEHVFLCVSMFSKVTAYLWVEVSLRVCEYVCAFIDEGQSVLLLLSLSVSECFI